CNRPPESVIGWPSSRLKYRPKVTAAPVCSWSSGGHPRCSPTPPTSAPRRTSLAVSVRSSAHGAVRAGRGSDETAGVRRLPAGTGNGNPRFARRPLTWFCAWHWWVQTVGGFATSGASSTVPKPSRPPLATSHTDTLPQWATDGEIGSAVLQSAWLMRVATCELSRRTKFDEKSLAMLTRVVTLTQKRLGGPVVMLVQSLPRNSPTCARKLGLSK